MNNQNHMISLILIIQLILITKFVASEFDKNLPQLIQFESDNDYNYNIVNYGNNPDEDLTTPEIITRHGYIAQTHTIETEDGYLLNMHRIPCGRQGCRSNRTSKQPVLLNHCLLCSSADWVISGPEKGLAFILADLGYDVWMGNARGNTYSRHHTNMSNEDAKYWDFSWHEMAYYDVPAEIDFIYNFKKNRELFENESNDRNLIYIGHSMGTTMAMAMLATRPEYNQKIKVMIFMALVANVNHVKSPIHLLAPFSKDFEFISKLFGVKDFMPQNAILKFLSKNSCELLNVERKICENLMFVICGFDKQQYQASLMPVIFGHTPAGTSTKTLIHYLQEIHDKGNFQQFDYGADENLKRYGQKEPPIYNISNIKVPTALFYANNDWLVGPKDVMTLYEKMQKTVIGLFKIPIDNFNHVDFLWGKDAPEVVYKNVITIIEKF